MKFSKSIVALIAGVSFAGIAHADDAAAPATAAPAASAEKKAMIQEVIPTAYGSIELRHKTNRVMAKDKVVEDNVQLQARPTLGATFFDGALDSSFLYIFSKTTDSTAVKKVSITNDTYLTVLETKFGDLKAYAATDFGTGGLGQFNGLDLMAYFSTDGKDALKFATPIGETGLVFEEYVGPHYTSDRGQETTKVKRTSDREPTSIGLAPAADGSGDEMKQRDPSINTITVALPYFKPSLVPGLKLSAGFEGYTTHKPKYEEDAADGTVGMTGYQLTKNVINRATISYKLTDKIVVANSIRQSVDGAWEKGVQGARWENRLVLNATLF